MKLEKKLERHPYVHNWARSIGSDLDSTVRNLVHLALGFPVKTYVAAGPIIRDRIGSSLDFSTAMKAALTTGRANSRQIVSEYVAAFYEYDESRKFSGRPTFDEMVEPFRISKGLVVPVKPLINIVENGQLTPIFSVGWATFPLNKFQMRLLATVIEDAVFSLTDFRKSPGHFLCFPNRVLKKSVAFADEAGIVSVVDIDMPDKASSGAKCCPSATTDRVILVLSFPRELRTG